MNQPTQDEVFPNNLSHRPTRDMTLLMLADVMSRRSTCSRAQVGAIISIHGRVLSTGYNGAPAGRPHCQHPCTCSSIYLNQDPPPPFPHQGGCPATQACGVSVHAEANAVAFAARHGVAVEGAEMHTTLSPCVACAQLLINAGIIRVISMQEYRIRDGLVLLENAGIALA